MEKIIKKVEIEQDFYVAYDGTEFEDEDECAYYEDEQKRSTLLCFDCEMKKCNFEDAEWVVVRSMDDMQNIIETCDFNGWVSDGICEDGLYCRSAFDYYHSWKRVRLPISVKDYIEFYEG